MQKMDMLPLPVLFLNLLFFCRMFLFLTQKLLQPLFSLEVVVTYVLLGQHLMEVVLEMIDTLHAGRANTLEKSG
jgi:hypothetical protein